MSRSPTPPLSDLPFLIVAMGLGFHALLKRLRTGARLREDLAVGMGSIFFALCDQDDCIMKDLATRLHIPKGTLSGLLTRMERMDLIKRLPCPEDGRAQRVRLTRKARALEGTLRARHEHALEVLQSGLTSIEVHELQRLLRHVLDNLHADEKPASLRTRRSTRSHPTGTA